jgi:hypothetical protein
MGAAWLTVKNPVNHALSIQSEDRVVDAASVFQRDEAETARMTRAPIADDLSGLYRDSVRLHSLL